MGTLKIKFIYFFISLISLIKFSVSEESINEGRKLYKNFEFPQLKGDGQDLEEDKSDLSRNFEEIKTDDVDRDDAHKNRKTKPLKNIFMGIYKNYKSTYLGNRTTLDYRKSMTDENDSEIMNKSSMKLTAQQEEELREMLAEATTPTTTEQTKKKKKKKKKNKNSKNKGSVTKKDEAPLYSYDGEYRYNVGPGVNVSLDMKHDIVNVNLDGDNLKDILLGDWNDDRFLEKGRGKKYEMITKILPLFILPFLIQSAIIPFLVTKLKLLLVKSILIGKLAIFLLIISAIKNNQQKVPAYESPSYWAAEPSRRSELFNSGYRVEGRPAAWVN